MNNQENSKQVLRMQPRASKRNNLMELGFQDGKKAKQPQYPEIQDYYTAWTLGYREYLLGDSTTPVA